MNFEQEILDLKARNAKVELNTAWETSRQFFWKSLPWHSPLDIYAALREQDLQPMLFFSGVTVPIPNGGRYSFLPFAPLKNLVCSKNTKTASHTYIQHLRDSLGAQKVLPKSTPKAFEHFCGGIAGFFSYEFAHTLEQFSFAQQKNPHIPLAYFQLFETLFAFDHTKDEVFLGGWFANEAAADQYFQKIVHNILPLPIKPEKSFDITFVPEITKTAYITAIEYIHQELIAGNSFQVNFSQCWKSTTSHSSWDIFCHLAQNNAAPMMFFCEHKKFEVLSCTPERLFSLFKNIICTQPIKGTRPRGNNAQEDEELSKELLHDKKELAEHSMIVDLLRNDFGRVATFGTVEVSDFLRVEKYPSVIHLVSDIIAKLPSKKDAFDVLAATFPGGSITGAPKIETMNIISRLEQTERGVYCGSAGYFSFNGNADCNILIRTLQKHGTHLQVRAGGGIVIDSTAEREYAESLEKVMGIIGPLGKIESAQKI